MLKLNRTFVATLLVGLGLVGFAVVHAQSKKVRKLTAEDYIQIQQLVAHYPFALDGGLDHGKAFADLFSDDGEFHQQPTPNYPTGRIWKGREQLLTIANKPEETPNQLGHFIVNHEIDPTADGAVGQEYLIGPPPNNGYRYEDVYVKTPAGWRFKSRTVITGVPHGRAPAYASKGGESSQSQPSAQPSAPAH